MLDTRPFCYYIRVDSKFNFEDEENGLEYITDRLIEEFGDYESNDYENNDCELQTGEELLSLEFPVVSTSCGYSYGVARWKDIIPKSNSTSEYGYMRRYNICKAYHRYKKEKHTLDKYDKYDKNYYSKFWQIIEELDNSKIGVSIKDVLDYERTFLITGQGK